MSESIGEFTMNDLPACEQCGSNGNLRRCARCLSVYYCSKEHQVQHWKSHRRLCKKKSIASHECQDIVNVQEAAGIDLNKVIGDVHEDPNISTLSISSASSTSPCLEDNTAQSPTDRSDSPITVEGSSEQEILNAETEVLSPDFKEDSDQTYIPEDLVIPDEMPSQEMPIGRYVIPSLNLTNGTNQELDLGRIQQDQQRTIIELCNTVVADLSNFGVSTLDNFLGPLWGDLILKEVKNMHDQGVFEDGQLVRNRGNNDLKNIRGDQITWVDGKEESCKYIGTLISRADAIITRASRMLQEKNFPYTINGRTKAMVACYPGNGTHYVKHVDNPNHDGRCITAIYYLNKDWDIERDGGLLRIFPEGWDHVANVEPVFDRIVFFWSDRRNPHEVQPAYRTRYAMTLWYFDSKEREEACRRHQKECFAATQCYSSSSSTQKLALQHSEAKAVKRQQQQQRKKAPSSSPPVKRQRTLHTSTTIPCKA